MWPFKPKKHPVKAPSMMKVDLSQRIDQAIETPKAPKPKSKADTKTLVKTESDWPPENLIGYYDIRQEVEGFAIRYRKSEVDSWSTLVRRQYQYVQEPNTYGMDRKLASIEHWPSLAEARKAVILHNQACMKEIARIAYERQFPKPIETVGPKR